MPKKDIITDLKKYQEDYGEIPQGLEDILQIFVFTCSNRECQCLNEGVGVHFFTTDPAKAEEHARKYNSPMWVSIQSVVQYMGQINTIKQILKTHKEAKDGGQ